MRTVALPQHDARLAMLKHSCARPVILATELTFNKAQVSSHVQ